MSKSVIIPSFNDPFTVEVNNKKYSYPAGTEQTVPDDVASVIDNINANMPKEAPEDGKPGQVWTKEEKSAAWKNFPIELPETGTTGHFLKKTASGCEWAAAPGKALYHHSVLIGFEDFSLGVCSVNCHLITSSQTALTLATLKTWISANGAKSSASGTIAYYPASGEDAEGHSVETITVSSNVLSVNFSGQNSASIPDDATLYDNVSEI